MTLRRHVLTFALLIAPAVVGAQGASGDYIARNFRFASGEVLPELRLHYRTLGHPRRDVAGHVTNAVMILHGTTGSGAGFLSPTFAGVLFGPGELLDSATHFIVLPDGIGHGGSSKPSDGMRMKFPRYTYDDMVDAQHLLLTEGLKVDHLMLVLGTSMGAMHCWVWGERFPTFVDALVPLASVPTQIAGRNRMMRTMIIDDIRSDPEWKGGEYTAQPRGLRAALGMLFMMTSSPLTQQRAAATRDAADSLILHYLDARMKTMDANDVLYAFDASRDYNPAPMLSKIQARVLAINSADDEVNPPELGMMDTLITRDPHGRYVQIPTSPATHGLGTHSLPAIWKGELARLLEESVKH
jgi:homoserine O-acetyltransferase